MKEKRPTSFKIGSETETLESNAVFQEELRDLRLEKLGHRVTLLTILIPCLIGIILVVGYLDIQDRLTRTSTSGTQGMQALTQELNSKFSSLSLKQARLEAEFSQKLPDLEKTAAVIQSRLRTAQKGVHQLEETVVDKATLDQALSAIDQRLAPLPKQIESAAARTQAVEAAAAKEVVRLDQALRSAKDNLLKLEAEIVNVGAAKADKAEIETTLKKERLLSQLDLRQNVQTLENRIKALEKKLADLAARLPDSAASAPPPAQAAPAAPPVAAPQPAPTPKPAPPAPTPPKPGTIIEQDLN